MSLNDPLADMLTRIRNGKMALHRFVDITYSKLNIAVCQVLKDKGFIINFLVDDHTKRVRVYLKYRKETRESVISDIKRVSKPGCRQYVGYKEIPTILSGLGISILSTPKGVIDGETAKREKTGGEILCAVW